MFLLLPVLAGCAANPSGIWMLTFLAEAGSGGECTETVTENFTDAAAAVAAEDGLGWTYTEQVVGGDSVAFAEFVETEEGDLVLLIGSEAYPGAPKGEGWTFTWSTSSSASTGASHVTGYTYSEALASTVTTTISLAFDGDVASGSSTTTALDTTTYRESDGWTADIVAEVGEEGQIPAGSYLEIALPDGSTVPAANTYNRPECDADPCELVVAEECSDALTLSAVRTTIEDPSAYGELMGAGQ